MKNNHGSGIDPLAFNKLTMHGIELGDAMFPQTWTEYRMSQLTKAYSRRVTACARISYVQGDTLTLETLDTNNRGWVSDVVQAIPTPNRARVIMDEGWINDHKPVTGDIFVVYPDGYVSKDRVESHIDKRMDAMDYKGASSCENEMILKQYQKLFSTLREDGNELMKGLAKANVLKAFVATNEVHVALVDQLICTPNEDKMKDTWRCKLINIADPVIEIDDRAIESNIAERTLDKDRTWVFVDYGDYQSLSPLDSFRESHLFDHNGELITASDYMDPVYITV